MGRPKTGDAIANRFGGGLRRFVSRLIGFPFLNGAVGGRPMTHSKKF